jgi:hypothetical protein
VWIPIFLYGYIFWVFVRFRKPKSVTKFKMEISKMANQAKVTATWVKSVSAGVVSQHVKVTVNGTVLKDEDIAPDVESYDFVVDENTHIEMDVTASNGSLVSAPAHGVLDIGSLNAPEAPTGLALTSEVVAS